MSVTDSEFEPREAETDTVYPEAPPSPSVPPSERQPEGGAFLDETDRIAKAEQPIGEDTRMPAPGLRGEQEESAETRGGTLPKNWDSGADTKGHG